MAVQENHQVLLEGNYYRFRILHEIAMPPDDEPYYVLETESGIRHLLLKSFYRHYQFAPGMEIRCKVDKVNCSGKIFLEPDHPFCKPGDLLHFNFTSDVKILNSIGIEEDLLLLADPWGQPAHLQVQDVDYAKLKEGIVCRVDRIKKGKLLISDPLRNYFGKGGVPVENLPFTITGICSLAPNLEFYILEQNQNIHYLRTKYFSQYGFGVGDQIHARVLGEAALYQHYLEPVHPDYKPGEAYYFDVVRTEKSSVSGDTPSYILVIKDVLGHEYSLEQQGDEPPWIARVRAVVKEIRMSKCIFQEISIEG